MIGIMFDINKQEVYRGRAVELAVLYVDANKLPFPTCGLTGSSLRIKNQDDSFITRIPSAGMSWGATEKIFLCTFLFTGLETNAFKLGGDQSVYLQLDFGANSAKYEIKKFLTVFADIF